MLYIDELESFNNLLRDYAIYFLLGAALLVVLVIFFILFSDKKKPLKPGFEPFYLALGGFDNIKSVENHGSRLALKLLDYNKVDYEKLKTAGVTRFIKMADKLTLVIGVEASTIEKDIIKKKA